MTDLQEKVVAEREVQRIWKVHREELLSLDAREAQKDEHHLSNHADGIDDDGC